MKLVKMSMVAALLVGSSAFAIENTKVSGDAKLFYSTSDAKLGTTNVLAGEAGSGSLFDKDSSAADAVFNLDVTTDLVSNDFVKVSAGAGYTVLTSLGLENNLVSNVWGGSHTATDGTNQSYAGSSHSASALGDVYGGAKVENANWFKEAWVAATAGKTTLKLGRMELDTPLAYSEKWSAEVNTFESIVAINQDIPNTTLVGAFVGNGNGNEAFGQDNAGEVTDKQLATGPIVNAAGKFETFASDGAYAFGVVNNSFEPLTVQAWYYELPYLLNAYWLQADLNIEGVLAGVQYSAHDIETVDTKVGFLGAPAGAVKTDSNVMAAMLGYEMKDVATIKVAYSQVDDKFAAGFNVATATGNSKLYTQTFWNYGLLSNTGATAADTETMKVSISSPLNGLFDVCASYTSVDQGTSGSGTNNDLDEIALVVKKSFGPLDAKLAYINVDRKNIENTVTDLTPLTAFDDSYSMVQAYLTLNF